MSNPLVPPGSKLRFFSTPGEIYRVYVFPGYDEIMITGTTNMAIDKDDRSHRLLDSGNVAHFVPASFIHLFWQVEEDGNPIFNW